MAYLTQLCEYSLDFRETGVFRAVLTLALKSLNFKNMPILDSIS